MQGSKVENLLDANGLEIKKSTTQSLSRVDLSKNITNGTLYPSCWMTRAQIAKLKTEKVLFKEFE